MSDKLTPNALAAQVLIVEDEEEHADVMAEALRKFNHVCTVVGGVESAMEELKLGTFDVIITDLPMVDQGRKGYCVPATFERVLRYYGLSEDMNVLAMAGQTGMGGGTSIERIEGATYNLIRDAGGNITQKSFSGNISEIKPFIDAGKPVLFPHFSTEEFNKRVDERMARRVAMTNWDAWKNQFLPSFKKTVPLQRDPQYGHICLIIGYNEKTREIAISDSWGQAATERWMTEDEARQIKDSAISVIE
jgi:CheY-like chemotaxis protein